MKSFKQATQFISLCIPQCIYGMTLSALCGTILTNTSIVSIGDELSSPKPSRHYVGDSATDPNGFSNFSDNPIKQVNGVNQSGFEKQESVWMPLPLWSPIEEKKAENRHTAEISIVELQQLAAEQNPTMKILRQKINAAHGDLVQSKLKPNPGIAYEAEEVGDGGKAGKHGVVLEQEIRTGGKRRLDQLVAGWAKDESCRRWEYQYQSIQNDVRARTYELIAAQRIVEIDEKLSEIGKNSVAIAEQLGAAGEVSKIDLLQIRAKANEAQAALRGAQSEEVLAWKRVAAMVGISDWQPHHVVDSLENVRPNIDREVAWQWILESSPKLAVIRSKVKQAQAVLAREQAEKTPDITVSGGVHYDFGEKQTLGSIGVGVPLKIFDRNQGNILKAKAELAATRRELDRQVLLLYEEFAEIYAVLDRSQEQVNLYREKILPDVQEAIDLCLKGYRQGEYAYMDLLSAQQMYLESQTQYIQMLKDHAIACVYLDGHLAKGGLDSE